MDEKKFDPGAVGDLRQEIADAAEQADVLSFLMKMKEKYPSFQVIVIDTGCSYMGCDEAGIPLSEGLRLCTKHADELGYCVGCGKHLTDKENRYAREYGMCPTCMQAAR